MKISSVKVNESKARVMASYTDDTPITSVDIAELPLPENTLGKASVLYINPQTGELWYEYEDIPLLESERLLKEEIKTVKNLNAKLTFQLMEKGVL